MICVVSNSLIFVSISLKTNSKKMKFVILLTFGLLWQLLDFCNSSTCGWTNHNFNIDINFNDVSVEEGVLESHSGIPTGIICQRKCLNNAECVSFFANRITGTCKVLSVKLMYQFVKDTQHIVDIGSKYYNLQDPENRCTDYIWDRIENKCYFAYPTLIGSYGSARQFCLDKGEDLLVTETLPFLQRVKRQIKSNFELNSQSYFMGATDKIDEGTWLWVNGNIVSINNWRTGFPKNQTASTDYMLMVKGGASDWKWIDALEDSQSRKYICERIL